MLCLGTQLCTSNIFIEFLQEKAIKSDREEMLVQKSEHMWF